MAISNEAAKIIKTGTAALSDKKAENIKVIDISEISVIADALVIASGNNPKQIQAMSDEVDEKLSGEGFGHYRLQPENDTMEPIIVDHVEILGRVYGVFRFFN